MQGVGFRPFVSRLAHEFSLFGWVRNRSGDVEIVVEGSDESLRAFESALLKRSPPLSKPEMPQITTLLPKGYTGFVIQPSESGEKSDTHLPPDYFVCADCLAEMQDRTERRYRYPFINCTQCGPRYTLIDRLPYDRPNTAMADFTLCPQCKAEYDNPLDRRYHAQPLACSECGPHLTFRRHGFQDLTDNEAAIKACLDGLRNGLIVAVKGVGGYHLLCDATNSQAVMRLRQRKSRPHKPLAVMIAASGEDGMAQAQQLADMNEAERRLLSSPLRPIVLVPKRADSVISAAIAPELRELGLMLPYSPLHHLLVNDFGNPLVATSANLSGEPVLTEPQEVEARLGQVADAFLHHNRPIRRPADDSVYRQVGGKIRPIRIGRGLAPIERKMPFQFQQPLLAVGADLKNTVALGFGDRLVISPHIGDLGSLRSAEVFEQVILDFQRLYNVRPQAIVCDAHPGYYSSRWAQKQQLPLIPVYHHHAHASALAGEYGLTEQMLVFTWDGTGYGEDGSTWGGETLLGASGAWRRVGSLRPFYLPGGDKASRDAWRCALSVCWELGLDWNECPEDSKLLRQVWERRLNCPLTSSAGRLFDAASALIGVAQHSSYEGHAAMRLEAISTISRNPVNLPISENPQGLLISDWQPLMARLQDVDLSPELRASLFHGSMAATIADQAKILGGRYSLKKVGLAGGVFQNRILTEQAIANLKALGFEVYLPESLPAGDGGLSFGQLIEAAKKPGLF